MPAALTRRTHRGTWLVEHRAWALFARVAVWTVRVGSIWFAYPGTYHLGTVYASFRWEAIHRVYRIRVAWLSWQDVALISTRFARFAVPTLGTDA